MSKAKNFIKIVGISRIEIDFVIPIYLDELDKLKLSEDLSEFKTIADIENFIEKREKFSYIEETTENDFKGRIKIESKNFIVNTCIFTNRSFKEKVFIEILSMEEPKFENEFSFFNDLFKLVTEQNFIFFVESNVLNAPPLINISVRILSKDVFVNEISFKIESSKNKNSVENKEGNNENDANDDNIATMNGNPIKSSNNSMNLYEKLNYDFSGTNYLILDFNDFVNYHVLKTFIEVEKNDENVSNSSKNSKSTASNVNLLLKKFLDLLLYLFFNFSKLKKVLVIKSISNDILSLFTTESISILKDIISYCDTFLIEKEISDLLIELLSSEQENKQHKRNKELDFVKLLKPVFTKTPRLCLIMDKFNKLCIIEQQPETSLLLAHTYFDFSLFPKSNSLQQLSTTHQQSFNQDNYAEYNLILDNNPSFYASIFLGGFMSRLVHLKSLKTCFIAGNDSVKRVLEVIKLGLELPNDMNYYLIVVPKNKKDKQKNVGVLNQIEMKSNKDSNFILDCVNKNESRMKHYNPLYDQSLSTFFSSFPVRSHLLKLGFINKQGEILQDPDKKRMTNLKSKKLLNDYEQEELKLQSIKENNIKMKLQIKNLFNGTIKNFQEVPVKELEQVIKVRNFKPISKQKLPSIPSFISELSKNMLFTNFDNPDLYYKTAFTNKFKKGSPNKTRLSQMSKFSTIVNSKSPNTNKDENNRYKS